MAIILGRIIYILATLYAKNSKNLFKSLLYYKYSNLIRYIFLIIANFFNIGSFIYSKNFIYLILIIILFVLNFAYQYRFTEFKKDFVKNTNDKTLIELKTYFE